MDDAYIRLVYEFAVLHVKDNPAGGVTIEKKNLCWDKLTNDTHTMMLMIGVLRQNDWFKKTNNTEQIAENLVELEDLKKRNAKFWEVAHYFDTQRLLNEVDKEITHLENEIDELKKPSLAVYDEIKKAKKPRTAIISRTEMDALSEEKIQLRKAKIKDNKRKFNELAESIDLVSRYPEPIDE